jgi:hypothetical protein
MRSAAGVVLAACHGASREPLLSREERDALCVDDVLGPLATLPGALASLGYAYVRGHPEDNDAVLLVDAVFAGIDPGADLTEAVRATIDAEHASGDVVEAEGWRLARTEARLAALLYLSEQC